MVNCSLSNPPSSRQLADSKLCLKIQTDSVTFRLSVCFDIESLLIALGAERSEGRGSHIRFLLGGAEAVFHRPHPKPEIDKGTVANKSEARISKSFRKPIKLAVVASPRNKSELFLSFPWDKPMVKR
ncbi:addiction module toxin, HicA family [Methylocystis heyeri]|uniref:Addiction module toxin, HicA family n=2 Tax=Methylocystis heyeri TaxID=391905 RepID=A0A6B8KLN1_9HYPH|nr:type II toxin-antitoxin system HicA family toxin [Methylocystis heyeri]QGM47975.1 addiction module toxin, HicA family [Methylocystis heyeri]